MPQPQYNAMPGPDMLEAIADQEAANGNEVNANEFRRRAGEWREDLRTLERVQIELQAANDSLQHIRTTLQVA
ncbi:MAG TPA: hypothetical protein VM619_14650 [Luteimonas sp.]|nr:hypothetical protein [Luteimonas sp.]